MPFRGLPKLGGTSASIRSVCCIVVGSYKSCKAFSALHLPTSCVPQTAIVYRNKHASAFQNFSTACRWCRSTSKMPGMFARQSNFSSKICPKIFRGIILTSRNKCSAKPSPPWNMQLIYIPRHSSKPMHANIPMFLGPLVPARLECKGPLAQSNTFRQYQGLLEGSTTANARGALGTLRWPIWQIDESGVSKKGSPHLAISRP